MFPSPASATTAAPRGGRLARARDVSLPPTVKGVPEHAADIRRGLDGDRKALGDDAQEGLSAKGGHPRAIRPRAAGRVVPKSCSDGG